MSEEFKLKWPKNTMETIWIGALGKLLVQKGVLTHEEVIAELQLFRQVVENVKQQTVETALICAEIDNAILQVRRW
ncbi:UNVERIFIED_ORG: hypothetical protein M2348_003270 [Sphingomonas sp. R1F5B]